MEIVFLKILLYQFTGQGLNRGFCNCWKILLAKVSGNLKNNFGGEIIFFQNIFPA
jgi:hypothetical protein